MKNLNLVGILAFLLIVLVYFLVNNNNNNASKKELVENIEPIKKKENIISNDYSKEPIKNKIESFTEKTKEPIKKVNKSNKVSSDVIVNKDDVDKLKETKLETINKRPTSLDQLKKDLKSGKDKLNLSRDNNINFVPNEKSDPYSKPLIPQEIDRIKQNAKEYEPDPVSSDDIVELKTNRGNMKLKLFPDLAPKHCYNFKKLANSGFYDGTTFHRIIPNFMIQGGDILSRDGSKKNDGTGSPGWTVEAEFNDNKHRKGILSMARSSDPNSAGSQFFICHADAPHLDGKYTVFGEVVENLDVIDKIVNAPTEYSETKKLCLNAIPDGENKDNWVELLDPKTRRKLYAKVPSTSNNSSFKYEMNSKLRNNNPLYAIRILSIRVD